MAGRGAHFYHRDGCHLCEEMAAQLFHDWPGLAAAMEWRDVDRWPAWREAFGLRVPVLTLDGRVVCEGRLDRERVAACFGPAAGRL